MQIDELETMIEAMARSAQLRHQGCVSEALAVIDALLAAHPFFAPAFIERAGLLADLGRFEDGLRECEKYLAYAPPSPEVAAFRDDMREQALVYFDAAISAAPGDCQAMFRRANVHFLTGNFEPARQAYLALLALEPQHAGALNNLANIFVRDNRLDAALALYERVRVQAPDDALNNFNRANVLKDLHRLDDARQAYGEAILAQADFACAWLELSHCYLLAGQFELAWPLYEWRWKTDQQSQHYRMAGDAPAWLGRGSLRNKTIVLWHEQGLGDTLQFVRFVPRLADLAHKVFLRVPQALLALLRSLDPRVELIDEGQPLPSYDCHCPLASLPLALGLSRAADLASAPYLAADPLHVAAWAPLLASSARAGKMRIGVAWEGKHVGGTNHSRDIPLGKLLPLAALDADFVCLQKLISPADAALLAQVPAWLRTDAHLSDLGATAALIAQLDLVICVDTAIAHLAGALGKPCWLLLRHSSEWRWQFGRSDSLWYPSLRLFRQPVQGQWDAVVAQVAAQLRALV